MPHRRRRRTFDPTAPTDLHRNSAGAGMNGAISYRGGLMMPISDINKDFSSGLASLVNRCSRQPMRLSMRDKEVATLTLFAVAKG